jgi:hypothetical protein
MWWQPVEDVAANLFAWLISEKGGDAVGFSVLVVICIVSVIRWHHRQTAAKKLGMGSWYFIAICFVVAVAATGAGVYGLALREIGKPPTQPATEQKEIDLYTGNKITAAPTILDHKLSREEAQYLIGAIDKLNRLSTQIASLDFPSGLLPPTFASHVYPDGVDRLEPDAIDRFLPIMSAELKDFQAAFNAVVQIINADSAYKDDLSRIVGEHHLDDINGCVSEYFGALQDLKNENLDKPSRKLANSVVAGPVRRCEAARQGFVRWRDAMPKRLKIARKEVAAYL